MKSILECNKLVEMLTTPDFKLSDLEGVDVARESSKLDIFEEAKQGDGWKECAVEIDVPDGQKHSPGDPPVLTFSVPSFNYCSLVRTIKAALSAIPSSQCHFLPFKQFWKHRNNTGEWVHGELYSSDVFIQAHEELQALTPEDDCTLE